MGYVSIIAREHGKTKRISYLKEGQVLGIGDMMQIEYEDNGVLKMRNNDIQRLFVVDSAGNCAFNSNHVKPRKLRINGKENLIQKTYCMKNSSEPEKMQIIEFDDSKEIIII